MRHILSLNSWGSSSPPHLGLVWELCDLQGSEAYRQAGKKCCTLRTYLATSFIIKEKWGGGEDHLFPHS